MFEVVQRAQAGDLASIRQLVTAHHLAALGGVAIEENLTAAAVWAREAAILGDREDVVAFVTVLFARVGHDGDALSGGLGLAVLELVADEDEDAAASLMPILDGIGAELAGPIIAAAKIIGPELHKK